MQIRKDPISMNWVVQEDGETTWPNLKVCPFCPGQEVLTPQTIYSHVNGNGRVAGARHPPFAPALSH